MSNQALIRIVTHDGPFHSDEVLSVAILTKIFKNHQLIRTRDQALIDLCDIAVDVGSVYNHQLRRYDHHMSNPPTDGRGHLFSSAGLVWYHYHQNYLRSIGIPREITLDNLKLNIHDLVEKIIRNRWIVPIDRGDNGFHHGPTPISELVAAMGPIDPEKSQKTYNRCFKETVSMVSHLFERACFHAVDTVINKHRLIHGRKEYLHDNKIAVSEVEVKDFGFFSNTDVHFVIYPVTDYNSGDINYNIRPIFDSSNRMYKTAIPKEWCGISDEQIECLGLKDISFIHHSGFMAKARNKDSAILFCERILSR